MGNSWTSKLRGAKLSQLIKLVVTDRSKERLIDTFQRYSPPGALFESEELSKSFSMLSVVHDLYMGADCSSYSDYNLKAANAPNLTLLLGTLQFEVTEPTGRVNSKDVPIIFASSTCVEDKAGNKYISGTRGFYSDHGFMCCIGDNAEQIKRTFLHEFNHAMVSTIPELKSSMYGETESIMTEEIVNHFITDHFDQLANLMKLDFEISQEVLPCSGEFVTMTVSSPVDIKANGKSLVSKMITLKENDTCFKKFVERNKGWYQI